MGYLLIQNKLIKLINWDIHKLACSQHTPINITQCTCALAAGGGGPGTPEPPWLRACSVCYARYDVT